MLLQMVHRWKTDLPPRLCSVDGSGFGWSLRWSALWVLWCQASDSTVAEMPPVAGCARLLGTC